MVHLRDDELEWQELDGEVVVLDLRTSRYFVVNGSGTALWRLMPDGPTTDRLVAALVHRYNVPEQVATDDVRAFINELDDRGLIVS